jgi:hypothetical protein
MTITSYLRLISQQANHYNAGAFHTSTYQALVVRALKHVWSKSLHALAKPLPAKPHISETALFRPFSYALHLLGSQVIPPKDDAAGLKLSVPVGISFHPYPIFPSRQTLDGNH